MHPEVFGYPAFLVVLPFAVAFGVLSMVAQGRRERLPMGRFMLVIAAVTLAGLAGGKLYSVLERGEMGPLDVELSNGFRYPGAIIGVAFSLPLVARVFPAGLSVGGFLDLLAPGIGIAMVVIRLHCLRSGCCAGSACSYGWCLTFPNGSPPFQHQMIAGLIPPSAPMSLPLHPLPVYFMGSSLMATIAALWFRRRARYAGQTFLVFLLVHETGKFFLEFLRFPPSPFVQAGSLALGIAALIALAFGEWRGVRRGPAV